MSSQEDRSGEVRGTVKDETRQTIKLDHICVNSVLALKVSGGLGFFQKAWLTWCQLPVRTDEDHRVKPVSESFSFLSQ